MDQNKKLITKLQYKNCEIGEFSQEQPRAYTETIALIESFPWEKQREKIEISLTCSSVTIQDNEKSFLKLSLYYNQKFVLYFFDGKTLYSKSMINYTDSYQFINEYFGSKAVSTAAFKKENTVLMPVRKHFTSNDFVYKVETKSIWPYIDGFTRITLLGYLTLILLAIFKNNPSNSLLTTIFIFLLAFPFLGGINLLLTINYYTRSKGKLLRLSKGANFFSFDEKGISKTFNKTDVIKIIIEKNTASRCPWNSFTLTTIYFSDGNSLKIASTILSGSDIERKFPDVLVIEKSVFIPFYLKT